MEWYFVLGGMVGLLVAFIAVGLPIPFALFAACLPFLWGIQSFSTSLVSTQLMIWGVWVDYVLLAVPLFVFVGELVGQSAIGPRLYEVMHRAVPIRGSAACGTIGACAAFGAVCGSSMVGALTIGRVALPEMLRIGYGRKFASGAVAAGGTLSVLIPPSLILLFYGIVTNVSIGDLFAAGAVPGITLALLFVLVALLWRLVRPADVPERDEHQFLTVGGVVLGVAPVVVIGGIIFGGIYFGICTPTEAAAVAVVATILIAFGVGGLSLQGLRHALTATLATMGFCGPLLAAAGLFGFVLTYYEVPQQLTQWFVALNLPDHAMLAMLIVFYLITGMFLDPISITVITVPTLFPLVAAAGYDLVWFGVVYTVTMEIAALTPPVGLNLYVLQRLLPPGELRVIDVVAGCLPFIGMLLLLIGLLILFPWLALWLPGQMH